MSVMVDCGGGALGVMVSSDLSDRFDAWSSRAERHAACASESHAALSTKLRAKLMVRGLPGSAAAFEPGCNVDAGSSKISPSCDDDSPPTLRLTSPIRPAVPGFSSGKSFGGKGTAGPDAENRL